MDLVVNHTSDEHAWFQESRDPASPKRDWYWWRPARAGAEPGAEGAEPTNWASFFSGSAWQFDERSGEYYLHLFSPKQPDLNWENPEVRQAVYAMMNRWVDRGVDGFRMDVINLISKQAELRDGDRRPGRRYVPAFDQFANGPRLEEFLQEMNAAVGLDERHLLTVGEMPGSTIGPARRVTDPRPPRAQHGLHLRARRAGRAAGRQQVGPRPAAAAGAQENLASWQEGLAGVGWNSLYWDNHDQPRAVSRFGDDSPEHRVDSAKTLATVQHLHQGTPYVYQGEELGMTNTQFVDVSSNSATSSRSTTTPRR